MWNRVKWAMVIALIPVALGQAGCNLEDATRPPLAGPSELGQALRMTANPDQLTANGHSSSVIEATLRDQNGNLRPGVEISFDLGAAGSGVFSDIGVLAQLGQSRPVPGGPNRPKAVSAVTNENGVARARYWSPFRTDQENDITVTITGRPVGNSDFREAIFRQVDIFLRAANRPQFQGTNVCDFIVEPIQSAYVVDQLIFFTATQITGVVGFPIARYEWDYGDGDVGPTERGVSHAFDSPNTEGYTVTLTTTEAQTGIQTSCMKTIVVTRDGTPPAADPGPDPTCPTPSASFAASQLCGTTPSVGNIFADGTNTTIFNGSASTAGAGEAIVSYRWSFGDGGTAVGGLCHHEPHLLAALDGLRISVVLTVDSCGATASSSSDFLVGATCP